MKKIVLVICAIALILSMTACKDKDKGKKNADTAKETVATETNKDGTPKETAKDTLPEGEIIEPNADPAEDETGIQGVVSYSDETDEDGNYIPEETMPEMITISDGGTDKGLWPDEVPDEVPVFEAYTEMYKATYERYPNCDFWSLTFDTTEADYNAWLAKVEKEGYILSDKVVGYYGKGDILLDIYPEDAGDIYYLSIDIYKTDKPTLPDVFPAFETDCVIYDWEDEDGVLSVTYECGTNFANDTSNYVEALQAKGFTIDGPVATLTSGGKTYTVTITDAKKNIEYAY
ncbi:MAG: hypothetical protein IKU52_00190 [Clostridia bacterium]|nr:hypothetical protein [Clostridia bacterium]